VSNVNRKIAEKLGWTDIYEEEWFEDYSNLFGTFPGAVRPMPLPDYQHDMNEAIAAMDCVEAPYKIYVDIQFTGASSVKGDDGKYTKGVARYSTRVSLHDANDVLWLKTVDSMEAVPAAICAAILQAHGVTVEATDGE
jgi:hypothetical protein